MFFKKKAAPVSWIAVFLGNPGTRFENTRHNAGFMTADIIEDTSGVRINRVKFSSLTGSARIGGQQVFLMKPQTYMNLSGDAVRQAMAFYKVPLENIIVVTDDVALPAGKLRVRRKGSAGGHNGLKDIIAKCGGTEFLRIKIGVGSPPDTDYDMADWVTSKFSEEDEKIMRAATVRAARAVETIIVSGPDAAMNEFNQDSVR